MNEWLIALPMYGVTAQSRDAQDALLSQLSAYLIDLGWQGTIRTTIPEPPLRAHWLNPRLLLSQTCGYPLMTELRDRVTLLATPRYLFEGCAGSDYSCCSR